MGTMPLPLAPGLFTVEDYHSFLETRPDDEGWQLIDGVAVMMTPPTLVHQRIGKNLCRCLDDILEVRYPQWSTLQEIGLIVPGYDHFRPKVDAAVVDKVLRLVRISEWKRHQAAPGPKVSRRAFGRERRYPISNGYTD